jgi:hypothetical protein
MSSASCGRSALNSWTEASKRFCCCRAVEACRAGRLFLEGQVHTLVAAVLLGMAGLDALDRNAEPEPPDRWRATSE